MEHTNTTQALLELIERPAFCVQDGCIVNTNQAAKQLMLLPGAAIEPFIADSKNVYKSFSNGSLSLNLTLNNTTYQAEIIKTTDGDLFVLDVDNPELRAIALAAQHLRNPLSGVMTVADQLVESTEHIAHLRRGLHRLHRIVCNMSDSYRYQQRSGAHLETTDITAVFDECMEAISTHLTPFGILTNYTGLSKAVIGLADREMLERAVYNLISNALKFMSEGSALETKLVHNGNTLSFTVQNLCQDAMPQDRPFGRYLREPAIEDSRNGIGLGMELVRSVAASHGGTVLVDHPNQNTTRITMTICITTGTDNMVRDTIQLPVSNYAGDRNRGLLELSEVLPASAYQEPN